MGWGLLINDEAQVNSMILWLLRWHPREYCWHYNRLAQRWTNRSRVKLSAHPYIKESSLPLNWVWSRHIKWLVCDFQLKNSVSKILCEYFPIVVVFAVLRVCSTYKAYIIFQHTHTYIYIYITFTSYSSSSLLASAVVLPNLKIVKKCLHDRRLGCIGGR